VRTRLQDLWAQVVERLADTWGREVRYGGNPPDPARRIAADFTRRELWQIVRDLAEVIDDVERGEAETALEVADAEDERRLLAATSRRHLASILERIHGIVQSGQV
jgi:hypothetical protein